MQTEQILELEKQTLKDLYVLSVKQVEIKKLRNELRIIENDMFVILTEMARSINELIKNEGMGMIKEIIEKHKFLQLVEDSKKALESVDRDFVENVENRVRLLESDLTKYSSLYGMSDYRKIEELENIEEKLKLEYDYKIQNPSSVILTILIWNSRTLMNSLSSRAVWLSYKKP